MSEVSILSARGAVDFVKALFKWGGLWQGSAHLASGGRHAAGLFACHVDWMSALDTTGPDAEAFAFAIADRSKHGAAYGSNLGSMSMFARQLDEHEGSPGFLRGVPRSAAGVQLLSRVVKASGALSVAAKFLLSAKLSAEDLSSFVRYCKDVMGLTVTREELEGLAAIK